jgi:hypothetical protein
MRYAFYLTRFNEPPQIFSRHAKLLDFCGTNILVLDHVMQQSGDRFIRVAAVLQD